MLLKQAMEIQNEQELIVLMSRRTLLSQRNGQNITVYATDSILQNIQKNNTITSYRIGSLSVIETKKLQNFFYFNGKGFSLLTVRAFIQKNKSRCYHLNPFY
jgi:competence protein ComEC